MIVKEKWTNDDFGDMNWHDSELYSVKFYHDDFNIGFDIDYLFKWELNEKTRKYKFWVSPCRLTFLNVSNLKINLDFQNNLTLSIEQIKRADSIPSPNSKVVLWDFTIETNIGLISFHATDYIQEVLSQPIFSQSQALGRKCKNGEGYV